MRKPDKYLLVHRITKECKYWQGYGSSPLRDFDLCEWVQVDENTKKLEQLWDAHIDTRYEAKLRLWKYTNSIERMQRLKLKLKLGVI